MKLYLVQHADAVPEDADPNRPLSDKGRADLRKVSAFLRGAGVQVDRIVHSGKLRAQQTAEVLAEVVCPGQAPEEMSGLAPNDATDKLCNAIAAAQGKLMVVGHMPFMSRAVARAMTGAEDGALLKFEPGSVACLERQAEGAARHWSLNWFVRPRQLADG